MCLNKIPTTLRGSGFKALLITIYFLTGCATSGPPLLASHTPPGSLYLAEVIGNPQGQLKRSDIVNSGKAYQWILASNIEDDDITDGSIERGRIYCCGGPDEGGGITFFYVPNNLELSVGDIVEIRAGSDPKNKEDSSTRVNIATRKILSYEQRKNNDSCHWDPLDERLWQRVLYCNWMLSEGWEKDDRWYKTPWYKLETDNP